MEPLFPADSPGIAERAMDVYRNSARLDHLVNPVTRSEIIRLLRYINSYYSNRIEGHHTAPADIARAANKDFSTDAQKKDLQLLSLAHIDVQDLIDQWLLNDSEVNVCSRDFLCSIHREFYNRVPKSFLMVNDPVTGKQIPMLPGEVRSREVIVGKHIPPISHSLPAFLERFAHAYTPENLVGHKKLIAAAASHHRITWIHPFMDGNGRVSRLFTYAYMRKINMESMGLWTLSRGFARHVDEYIGFLTLADEQRIHSLDGRGNLSESGLTRFCEYFFDVADDQISFMSGLLQLDKLRERVMGYVYLRSQGMIQGDEPLRVEASYVLAEVVMRGEIGRGEVQRISGLGERSARGLTSQLEQEGFVSSNSHRAPLRFSVPLKAVGYFFPALFPEGSI